MKKIAIVGSREYTNKKKIKEFIFKLKDKFGEEVEVVSGGQKHGADGYAKKFALEFDMKYVEFPPAHYPYNQHCIKEAKDYSRPYGVWHYSARNKEIAEYCDYVAAFIPKGHVSKGTNNTIGHAEKLNKKVVILD